MTYDEARACFPEDAQFLYWDVSQEEIEALSIDHWAGQTAGTWYLGTPIEIPELAAKRMLPE